VAFATESYPPNVKLARSRLKPLGVKVVVAEEGGLLPFKDGTFDLVTDRHTGYSAKEVLRVLRKGGIFITQQVGLKNNRSLRESLGIGGASPYVWNLARAVSELTDVGFVIEDQRQETTFTRFYDLGALAYYLKTIPWEIPDFTVERYFAALRRINRTLRKEGFIETERDRYLIVARRPAWPKA
jgi:SAM-dependent methyltransferase